MELLQLYLLFFKLGIVNFGGGYALFPLLEREFVIKRKWATNQELTDYYAVGQCTPGAFAVNISTFLGIKRKGVLGGIIATLGFISPAFIIIFIIASVLTNFASNTYVLNALAGIRVCVFFLIIYAISKLCKTSIKDVPSGILAVLIAICAISISFIPLYAYVIFAAGFGLLLSFIKEKRKEKRMAIEENPKEKKAKVKKEKRDHKPFLKSAGLGALGFFVGITFGLVGLPSFLFVKKKSYREGVLSSLVLWFIIVFGIVIILTLDSTLVFDVFLQFFKVGGLAFGGGLATIPFLNELSLSTGWFSLTDLANMLAVSESTPGAMGVNMSTYVGYTVFNVHFNNFGLSFLGSMLSTLGLVTPSVIVIFFVSLFLKKFKDNKYVEWIFYGLRAASIGLIFAAVYSVLKVSLFHQYVNVDGDAIDSLKYSFNAAFGSLSSFKGFFPAVWNFLNTLFNWKAVGLGVCFGLAIFGFKKHPILYIAVAAFIGICFSMHEAILV